jgi:hypothetical protein
MSETSPLFGRRTDRLRELRTVSIRDQADRDAIASSLLRHGDKRGDGSADIIDMLTTYPEGRRKAEDCSDAQRDWCPRLNRGPT